MRSMSKRSAAIFATGSLLAVALTACSSDSDNKSEDIDLGSIDCDAYNEFGDLNGKEVNVYTSIVEPESVSQKESYKPFEECTGVKINYEGSREFEAQLLVRIKAGNAPDIAYLPQPGLLNTIVKDTGKIVEAPDATLKNVEEYFESSWKDYGSVDGKFYAAPLGANVKSYVWYSPSYFEEKGYEVPETWDDLIALTEKISKEGDVKPWCAGIGSGDATGWPATDWLEDIVLREAGPDVYDQWYTHEIPFNDPQIVDALTTMSDILRNPDYVNAGFGDVKSIASTEWTDGGTPILSDECVLHRAANFYMTQWPEGTTVAPDGDVYAFYLPSMDDTKPILGGGEFVAAFSDRPEVQAFQTYLSSPDWANAKAKATVDGGWVSANKGLDPENLATEFDKLSAEILSDDDSVFRFDASDLMPGEVGAGTFWKGMVNFFAEDASPEKVLTDIENSWP